MQAHRTERAMIEQIKKELDLLLTAQHYEPALKMLDHAVRKSPHIAAFRLWQSQVFQQISCFDQAAQALLEALRINPQYQEARELLAIILAELGQYEDAFEVMQKQTIQGSQPSMTSCQQGHIANAHAETAALYNSYGLYTDAIREYQKALSLYPQMPDVRIALAQVYIQTQQWHAAKNELSKVQSTSRDYEKAISLLGLVAEYERQPKAAADYWLKTHQLNPHNKLATVYRKLQHNHRSPLKPQAKTQA